MQTSHDVGPDLWQNAIQWGLVVPNDDIMKWKHFPLYWAIVRGIHRSPVNSPHKGQWCGALMFSLICAWINSWVNNREAGDLRRHCTHYDVTVMIYGTKALGHHWFREWLVARWRQAITSIDIDWSSFQCSDTYLREIVFKIPISSFRKKMHLKCSLQNVEDLVQVFIC